MNTVKETQTTKDISNEQPPKEIRPSNRFKITHQYKSYSIPPEENQNLSFSSSIETQLSEQVHSQSKIDESTSSQTSEQSQSNVTKKSKFTIKREPKSSIPIDPTNCPGQDKSLTNVITNNSGNMSKSNGNILNHVVSKHVNRFTITRIINSCNDTSTTVSMSEIPVNNKPLPYSSDSKPDTILLSDSIFSGSNSIPNENQNESQNQANYDPLIDIF